MKYMPGTVLHYSGDKSLGIWFVLSGVLSVYDFKNDEGIMLNQISQGMSCGDPEMNVSVSLLSTLQVTSKDVAKCFFLPNTHYEKILGVKFNQIWNDRQLILESNFEVLQNWEY
jgi:hypothetical protein